MKTYMPNASAEPAKWWVVDATDVPLGRLCSQVAAILRGKHKPTYTPHADMGDYVIVVNCAKVALTGDKQNKQFYKYHTLYPGGDKTIPFGKLLKERSDFLVQHTIKGMMPKNALGKQMLKKLRVYVGPEHEHQAQNPAVYKIKGGK